MTIVRWQAVSWSLIRIAALTVLTAPRSQAHRHMQTRHARTRKSVSYRLLNQFGAVNDLSQHRVYVKGEQSTETRAPCSGFNTRIMQNKGAPITPGNSLNSAEMQNPISKPGLIFCIDHTELLLCFSECLPYKNRFPSPLHINYIHQVFLF